MSPAVAPGGKAPSLDFRHALLETFTISEKASQLLLRNIPDAAWDAAPPSSKGRTIAARAGHIRRVRLMWLSAADKSAKPLAKRKPDKVTRAEVQAALKESAAAVESDLQMALDDLAGKVPSFKANVVAFIGSLIAHVPHPGSQIVRTPRLGHPVDRKTCHGLWGWGSRCDCGLGTTAGGASSK